MNGADEFETIAQYFAPLAGEAGARGLLDDAALLDHPWPLVITTDAIIEGVHFLPDDPIETIARKALRVNLSDLAAKGAKPLAYLLTLAWPSARPAAQIAQFAQGLAADQAAFGLALLGGDTVSTPGPLWISIAMFGTAGEATPDRRGAQPGDGVYVTGTIGDGYLGLMALRAGGKNAFLIDRYRLPQPRIAFGAAAAPLAHAAMDLSDGLIKDAGKIAAASGVQLQLDLEALPLSPPAAAWLARQPDRAAALTQLACGGDDYEVLLTAPPALERKLNAVAKAAKVRLTRLGQIEAGQGLVDPAGRPIAAAGYAHRLGR